ncbi:RNA degradosome polyphosphate kinase, partial [bacterium]|nr:RNA degradosome polyphosphate kinase [bacterium]
MSDSLSQSQFINRELSLLEFHDRVLSQAENDSIPPLERLRFLCISSTNLDEFFEIRVGGLKERFEAGSTLAGPEGLTPRQQLDLIADRAHQLVDRQYQILNEQLLPLLAQHQLRIIKREDWSDSQT